jgi:hypothetical protein
LQDFVKASAVEAFGDDGLATGFEDPFAGIGGSHGYRLD